jgi:hypothetical protein
MVRPQSVTDRGDGDAELAGEGDVPTVVLLGSAEDQPASVDTEQRRSRFFRPVRWKTRSETDGAPLGPGTTISWTVTSGPGPVARHLTLRTMRDDRRP